MLTLVIESPRVLIKQSNTVCITLLVCVRYRQAASLFISGDIFLGTLSAGYIGTLVGSSDCVDK